MNIGESKSKNSRKKWITSTGGERGGGRGEVGGGDRHGEGNCISSQNLFTNDPENQHLTECFSILSNFVVLFSGSSGSKKYRAMS